VTDRDGNQKNEWRKLAVTALFLCLAVACGKWFSWHAQQYRDKLDAWQFQRAQSGINSGHASDEMYELLRSNPWAKALTVEQLEQKLESGPLKLIDEGQRQYATWQDPNTGMSWRFSFLDGLWVSVRGRSPDSPAEPSRSPVFNTAEKFRAFWFHWDFNWLPYTWLVGFILALLIGRYRTVLSLLLLALGFTCYVGYLVQPTYTFTVRGYFSNDMLVFGLGMTMLSIALVTFCFRDLWPQEGIGNQFRLRSMLIVVTLLSVALSMGAYGIVMGLTLLFCFAFSIGFRYLIVAKMLQPLPGSSVES
jgi:hypothetical protein